MHQSNSNTVYTGSSKRNVLTATNRMKLVAILPLNTGMRDLDI